jgi:NTE family protein
MRSGTNADLAEGHGAVLVVAPISAQMMGAIARSQARELSALQAAGARVAWIEPDAEALEAFGPNLMDTSRGPVVAAAGTRQGKAAAARVAALWG